MWLGNAPMALGLKPAGSGTQLQGGAGPQQGADRTLKSYECLGMSKAMTGQIVAAQSASGPHPVQTGLKLMSYDSQICVVLLASCDGVAM